MLRRFSLAELASTSAAELSWAFRARLAFQRDSLSQSLPTHLSGAANRLVKGLNAAEAASCNSRALAEAESAAEAVVDDLRGRHAMEPSTQQFLAASFSSLISQRALVQAAQAATTIAHSTEDTSITPRLLLPKDELHELLCDSVEDARAFCREKYGDSPETRVLRVREAGGGDEATRGQDDDELVFLAPFVAFPVHELLKNAYGAHCRMVGADRLDRCPPVEVRHGTRDGIAFISVSDWGGGLGHGGGGGDGGPISGRGTSPTDFLHTSNPEREANYTYSRNFGAPFEGLGMGLPLARLHARYHGGQLHVAETRGTGSYRGPGVHAAFTVDLRSRRAEPDEVALPVGSG